MLCIWDFVKMSILKWWYKLSLQVASFESDMLLSWITFRLVHFRWNISNWFIYKFFIWIDKLFRHCRWFWNFIGTNGTQVSFVTTILLEYWNIGNSKSYNSSTIPYLHLSKLMIDPTISLAVITLSSSNCLRFLTSHQSTKNIPKANVFIPAQRPT